MTDFYVIGYPDDPKQRGYGHAFVMVGERKTSPQNFTAAVYGRSYSEAEKMAQRIVDALNETAL